MMKTRLLAMNIVLALTGLACLTQAPKTAHATSTEPQTRGSLDWRDNIWETTLGGSQGEYAYSMATLSSGNIVIAGRVSSDNVAGIPEHSEKDNLLIAYSPDGDLIWANPLGANGSTVYIKEILAEEGGGFFITGYSNSTNLGEVNGGTDGFIAKYDKNGERIWIQSWGGSGNDGFDSLARDKEGNLYAVGHSYSTNLGLENNGGSDAVLVKFDKDGNHLWATSFGSHEFDQFIKVIPTTDGHIAVAARTYNNLDFPDSDAYGDNAVVLKYTLDGELVWAHAASELGYLGEYGVTPCDLVELNNQNIVLLSILREEADFPYTTYGYDDAMLLTYDPEGNLAWASTFGGSDNETPVKILQLADGDLMVAGESISKNNGFTNQGSEDAFFAKLSIDGKLKAVQSFGGNQSDGINAMSLNLDGQELYLLGGFFSTNISQLPNSGGRDIFLISNYLGLVLPNPKIAVRADTTTPYVSSVSLTISDTSGAALAAEPYSFDGGVTWQAKASKSIKQNGVVELAVKTLAGKIDTTTYTIDIIDETPPELTITGNPTEWTNKNVTLTATAVDNESGLHSKTYSYDGGQSWTAGKTITVTANQTLNIKAKDKLGNVTTVAVTIDKIDKTGPSISVSGNPNSWVPGPVTLSVVSSDKGAGLHDEPYSFDGGTTWQAENFKVFTTNQSVKVRTRDKLGNTSSVQTITINQIDDTAPTFSVAGNPTSWSSSDTKLTITAKDNSALHAYPYSFDGGLTWTNDKIGVITENGDYELVVRDQFGNEARKVITVSKIDKTRPTLSLSSTPNSLTHQDVVITATGFDADSGLNAKAYSFNNGSWTATNTLTVSKNQTVNVRVRDDVGFVTEETIVIDFIDKVAPTLSVTKDPTEWTKQDVTLTATATDDLSMSSISIYQSLTKSHGNYVGASSVRANTNILFVHHASEWDYSSAVETLTATGATVRVMQEYEFESFTDYQSYDLIYYYGTAWGPTGQTANNLNNAYAQGVSVLSNFNDDPMGALDLHAVKSQYSDYVFVSASDQLIADIFHGEVETDHHYSIESRHDDNEVWAIVTTPDGEEYPGVIYRENEQGTRWLHIQLYKANINEALKHVLPVVTPLAVEYQATLEATATISENGHYLVVAKDLAGNETSQTILVDNIDKTAPTILSISGADVMLEDKSARLTVSATDTQSGLHAEAYSLDGMTWQASHQFTLTVNGTYTIYVRDKLGNTSSQSVIVDVIYAAPTISMQADHGVDDWANTSATLTVVVEASSGIAKTQFQDNPAISYGSTPQRLTFTFDVTEPDYYYFDAWDARGLHTEAFIFIKYIDQTTPTVEIISSSNGSWTNQDVSLTIRESTYDN